MSGAKEISAQDAKVLLDRGEARLVDCREEDEYLLTRIEGAQLIPLSKFAAEAAGKLPDRNETILIHCHHGVRSLKAAGHLAALGYTDARSIRGGIDAWSLEIDPSVRRY